MFFELDVKKSSRNDLFITILANIRNFWQESIEVGHHDHVTSYSAILVCFWKRTRRVILWDAMVVCLTAD